MKVKKGLWFQKGVYFFLSRCFGWFFMRLNDYHGEKTKIKSDTFLLLANHNNDMDWAFPVILTGRHMRFVASSNIMNGFAGKLVKFLAGPIPRAKGASADDTAELIMENLKAGISVAIFPEGNKSWDGKTGFISERNARIVKESGCALVTYRTEGGYLRTPRWSDIVRKGPMFGRVVREYTKEELARMSVPEIAEAIRKDLAVNAFDFQREHMERYPGKDLTKNLDCVLYICPECHGVSTIKASADSFSCSCGLKGRMNEYGFLESLTEKPLIFDNTASWNDWQKSWLKENKDTLKESKKCLASDGPAEFISIKNGERSVIASGVTAELYADCLKIGEHRFPLNKISRFSTFRNRRLFFTCEEGYFELHFPKPVSGLKYDAIHRVMTDKAYE